MAEGAQWLASSRRLDDSMSCEEVEEAKWSLLAFKASLFVGRVMAEPLHQALTELACKGERGRGASGSSAITAKGLGQ